MWIGRTSSRSSILTFHGTNFLIQIHSVYTGKSPKAYCGFVAWKEGELVIQCIHALEENESTYG